MSTKKAWLRICWELLSFFTFGILSNLSTVWDIFDISFETLEEQLPYFCLEETNGSLKRLFFYQWETPSIMLQKICASIAPTNNSLSTYCVERLQFLQIKCPALNVDDISADEAVCVCKHRAEEI